MEWWLLVAIVAYVVLIGGPGSGPRFRVPAMPYLAVLAGAGTGAGAASAPFRSENRPRARRRGRYRPVA
jgi:hypothetical protein